MYALFFWHFFCIVAVVLGKQPLPFQFRSKAAIGHLSVLSNGQTPLQSNEPHFIQIPIDHFTNKTSATFGNRYWINATYWKEGGPVFLFDSGEQDAAPLFPYYLQEYHGLSAVMRLAKRYQGIAILWEHRFYGSSLPFAVNENTTANQWQFLSTEQALEDVVFFANSFAKHGPSGPPERSSRDPEVKTTNPTALPIHPRSVPWVFLGGSYPGIRAALLRLRNPEVVHAAWASSAPVQAQIDMASYYKAAERSLTRNCSADWVSVTRYVDDTLQNGDFNTTAELKLALLRARRGGPGGNFTLAQNLTLDDGRRLSNVEAASILMDPLDFYQYYGFKDSLLPFCDILETQNFTQPALENGIAASRGTKVALDAFLTGLSEIDYDSIPFIDDPVQDRSWMWQYCSEYGFYQRGDPSNPLSIQTSFLSLELFQEQCNEVFPTGLPPKPQVEKVNKYGGWNMDPSNVFFTNGEFDPWRTMGLASIESNSPHRTPSLAVPPCNTSPSEMAKTADRHDETQPGSFFGMTHANMVHVSDMRVLLTPDANHSDFKTVGFYSPIDPAPFFAGLGLFELALDEWLPCFVKSN